MTGIQAINVVAFQTKMVKKQQQQEPSHFLHRAAFVQFIVMVIRGKRSEAKWHETGMWLVWSWYEAGMKLQPVPDYASAGPKAHFEILENGLKILN